MAITLAALFSVQKQNYMFITQQPTFGHNAFVYNATHKRLASSARVECWMGSKKREKQENKSNNNQNGCEETIIRALFLLKR